MSEEKVDLKSVVPPPWLGAPKKVPLIFLVLLPLSRLAQESAVSECGRVGAAADDIWRGEAFGGRIRRPP